MPSDAVTVKAIRATIERVGSVELPSSGVSMFPIIREGCVSRFTRIAAGPRLGDVLLFVTASGAVVGHRLHRIEMTASSPRYICKGDSNLTPDAPVSREQLLGRLETVRYKRLRLRSDAWPAKLWSIIILRLPAVTRLLHHYLGWKRKRLHETIRNS